ncbi:FtsX-like permease family protein [Pseudactinotalea sp. HY160]|uniref:FtsX-like permease family protein n=1 Tax=Pseudactinotalea sp. HY160 TaxID=2654490 RepID=UPI001310629D|nr:FtsX-like permease family protein [Pseudactinotalea sp. HY160]
MTTLRLWRLLRRRSAGGSDPQCLPGILAVVAFAVATAISLVVLGGWNAFAMRAEGNEADLGFYVTLAATASGLLLIPLATLGGAAARLTVARRDERLAALRLAGATTRQVTGLTLLESAAQALSGGLAGVAGYFALIPIVQLVVFQQDPFAYGELVVPPWILPAVVGAVVLIATGSAAMSLRKVAITPLGVAARVSPRGLHWTRIVPIALAALAFSFVFRSPVAIGIAVLVAFVLAGLAALNLVGPFVVWLIGRAWAARARGAASLIAARRLIDSPKSAWRSVGGVGLATFIAGLCAALAMFTGTAEVDPQVRDMATGGFLTLAIAAIVAAVSTGVMQAGRIIDQRGEYRALAMAGMETAVMNRARMREIEVPLVAAVGVATLASGLFLVPALTTGVLTSIPVLVQFASSVLGATALVLLGAAAAGRVLRTVVGQAG